MSWYCKINDRETGPMEERTVINRLIDGEINSRTMLKDRFENDYRMLLETDFNAVLGHLTARWRYNIGALKREFIYLMVSLAVWLIPLLSYLGGLFNNEIRKFLFHYGVTGIFGFLSLAGFFSTCYFTWIFAYRLWRVVPKSQYKITPGWRIMLTYIPFFRFGWNYCMWIPLTNRLRALTNYSMRTGKIAAYFYSTSLILLACSVWSVAILPWSYTLLNGNMHEALWKNILGWIFIGLLLVSFIITLVSFIVMAQKMKKAALAILRHRYAYNVCTQTRTSHFLESTLKKQRHYDKVHRWGHGLGIGGVLIGWPLLLIGIPTLILFTVGSCRYEQNKAKIANMGYPSSLIQLYRYANVPDNALEDLRNIKNNNTAEQLNIIFSHNGLAVPADWSNPDHLVENSDISALHKVRELLKNETLKSLQKNDTEAYIANIARYNKYMLWLFSSLIPDVYSCGIAVLDDFSTIINSDAAVKLESNASVKFNLQNTAEISKVITADIFIIENMLNEARFDNQEMPIPLSPAGFWLHVYKYTPFIYFRKAALWNEVNRIAADAKVSGFAHVYNKRLTKYLKAGSIMNNTAAAEILKKNADIKDKINRISEKGR